MNSSNVPLLGLTVLYSFSIIALFKGKIRMHMRTNHSHRSKASRAAGAPVFMRDRITDRVGAFARAPRWYNQSDTFSHVAILLLFGLAAINVVGLFPVR